MEAPADIFNTGTLMTKVCLTLEKGEAKNVSKKEGKNQRKKKNLPCLDARQLDVDVSRLSVCQV